MQEANHYTKQFISKCKYNINGNALLQEEFPYETWEYWGYMSIVWALQEGTFSPISHHGCIAGIAIISGLFHSMKLFVCNTIY